MSAGDKTDGNNGLASGSWVVDGGFRFKMVSFGEVHNALGHYTSQ